MQGYALYRDPVGILLILYSAMALALIVDRVLAWRKARQEGQLIASQVQELLKTPDR